MGRLDGKACVVTGAGSGIGRACALRFAHEGGRVVCADIVEVAGRETAAAIESAGGEAAFFAVDVTDEASVSRLYAAAEQHFGAVHVLVNNAGVLLAADGSVLQLGLDAWQRTIDINLTGVFLCCKHGIPKLLAAGGGSVVNMASICSVIGSATAQTAYTASKGGVAALTREIAVELARSNVRVNSLLPGPVETPLALQLYPDEAAWQRRRVHIPSGRLGRPEEVADAALFLASDESSWITGSSLVVDGGITVGYTTPE
jgi:NAD(P)-dependent dehydrogenase (short-subunit alcohol dehydrogenase family)